MNTSDEETMFTEYNYDYDSSCDHDSPELLGETTVLPNLFYVLFCLGLLGMFKNAWSYGGNGSL